MGHEAGKKRDYRETLEYLFGLQRFGIKLGLTHIRALLERMGNPQAQLRAVHIAGSNGKGSTAAFLTSILREGGYRVGLYTSPHLIDFSERIQVDGVPIPEEKVVRITERIRAEVDQMNQKGELWPSSAFPSLPPDFDPSRATITFFEFTTAMAFLYFQESRVDVAVVETGMGGRLDATNVLDPLLCLISPLSLEHQQYLGRTLLQIAGEKAGIIKPKRPLLTTVRQPRILSLFRRKCEELQSPFYAWGKDFRGRKSGPQRMHFQGRNHRWTNLRLGLAGSHQVVNASLALAGAEVLMELGFPLSEESLRRGLAEAKWPGRLEVIGDSPKIVLDGAHNPAATRVLKRAIEEGFLYRRLILVLGIMGDKDIPKMMAHLIPLADRVILTRPRMDRAATLEVLRAHASSFGKPTVEIAEVRSAFQYALGEAAPEDLVVVTGSLYTVGEARAYLIEQGRIAA